MVVLFSIQMATPCGMDRGVVPLAPVAPSTHHHGSTYNYLPLQLMTLRSGSVVIQGLEMKILRYNSWSSMSSELDMNHKLELPKAEASLVCMHFYESKMKSFWSFSLVFMRFV